MFGLIMLGCLCVFVNPCVPVLLCHGWQVDKIFPFRSQSSWLCPFPAVGLHDSVCPEAMISCNLGGKGWVMEGCKGDRRAKTEQKKVRKRDKRTEWEDETGTDISEANERPGRVKEKIRWKGKMLRRRGNRESKVNKSRTERKIRLY